MGYATIPARAVALRRLHAAGVDRRGAVMLLALAVGAGGRATPTSTTTPIPIVPPVTAASTSGSPYAIRDTSGLTQATVSGRARDDGGIWRVGDGVGVTVAGLAAGDPLTFDQVTRLLVSSFGHSRRPHGTACLLPIRPFVRPTIRAADSFFMLTRLLAA